MGTRRGTTTPGDLDDPQEFLRFAALVAGEVDGVTAVTADTETFSLEIVLGDESMRLNLGHLHAQTQGNSADERSAEVQAWVQRVVSAAGREVTWEQAQTQLLPVVRSIGFARSAHDLGGGAGSERRAVSDGGDDDAGSDGDAGGDGDGDDGGDGGADQRAAALMWPFAPFLGIYLAVDFPDTMMYVTSRHCMEWNVTAEALYERAIANLAARAEDGIDALEDTDSPVWQVSSGDYYESSRLLVPGFLASFANRVDGRPIAIIPERSTMLVGGDQHPETIQALAELARHEYEESSRSISPAIYTVDDHGVVVPYERLSDNPDDEVANVVRLGHVLLALNEYNAQKEDLERHFEETGQDLFVASYSAVELESTGRPLAYAVWGRGMPTLLPRTDIVHIACGDPEAEHDDSFAVPWEALLEIVGDCVTPEPNLAPDRFRTVRWPTESQLAALQELACDLDKVS